MKRRCVAVRGRRSVGDSPGVDHRRYDGRHRVRGLALLEFRRHRLSLTVAALLAAALQAPSAAAAPIPPIAIPAGHGAILSGAQAGGCDDVSYGYEVGAAANQLVASKPGAGCPTSNLAGRAVPAQSSAQSLRIWLADTACVSSLASAPTYYSDGTSTGTSPSVDHALVSNSGPYIVTLDDAGGACPGTVQNVNDSVGPGSGQLSGHGYDRDPADR